MVFAAPSGKERRVWAFWKRGRPVAGAYGGERGGAVDVARGGARGLRTDRGRVHGSRSTTATTRSIAMGRFAWGATGFGWFTLTTRRSSGSPTRRGNAPDQGAARGLAFLSAHAHRPRHDGDAVRDDAVARFRCAPTATALPSSARADVRINPLFYQRMDPMFERANREGMLVAPVVLWANVAGDPGLGLPDEDRRAVARYVVARYGAYSVPVASGRRRQVYGGEYRRVARAGAASLRGGRGPRGDDASLRRVVGRRRCSLASRGTTSRPGKAATATARRR